MSVVISFFQQCYHYVNDCCYKEQENKGNNKKVNAEHLILSLNDIEKITVEESCAQSWPCRHKSTVFLKDGRTASGLNSYQICSIISYIAKKRINSDGGWNASEAQAHFKEFSKPQIGWVVRSPEEVLSKLFAQN